MLTVRACSFEHGLRSLGFDDLLESVDAVGVLDGFSRSHHHAASDGVEG